PVVSTISEDAFPKSEEVFGLDVNKLPDTPVHSTPISPELQRKLDLVASIELLSLGLLFYLFFLQFRVGVVVLHSMLIGHVIVFRSLLKLWKIDEYGTYVTVAIVLCAIDLLSKVGAIFGMWAKIYIELQVFELVAISAIFFKLSKTEPALGDFVRLSGLTLVTSWFSAVTLLLMMFVSPLLNYIVNTMIKFKAMVYFFNFFGILFPSLVLTFATTGLLIYTSRSILKQIRNLNIGSFD
ncbi:MAG TPA: hypothetical protein VHP63_02410, partial [candidate division Zixibacteria bacterium]|nr:hypothetical protein [candidate division Zixibacteria bacterium]